VLPGDTLLVGTIENLSIDPLGNLPGAAPLRRRPAPSTGMYEYDNVNLYARLEDVQDLLDLPADTIGMLAVNVADPWHAAEAIRQIRDRLGYPYATTTGWT
jgi:ABC-type lipoprotein release transport system permease subunit